MGDKVTNMRAYVFAGPKLSSGECVKNENFTDALIIAADCGLQNCSYVDVTPDVLIGDFDSLDSVPKPEGCEVLTYKVEKDDTDTMLCIRHALSKGASDVTIISGVGGRLDHTIANIQSLAFLLENNAKARLISDDCTVYLLKPGSYTFPRRDGFSMSLFSYGDKVSGLCIKGAKYPLYNAEIQNTFPIGVSNKITADNADISFESGVLLLIFSRL